MFPGTHEGVESTQILSGPGDIHFLFAVLANVYVQEHPTPASLGNSTPGRRLRNEWEVYLLQSAACLIASVASQIP